MDSLEDLFHPGAPQVVGDRVHLVQSGLDGTAAQEVFRVQLVEVKGQLGDPGPLGLTEAREDLKSKTQTASRCTGLTVVPCARAATWRSQPALTLSFVHISPSSTMSDVLLGKDWKNSSESTTVPSSSRTRVRNWQDNMKTLAVYDPKEQRVTEQNLPLTHKLSLGQSVTCSSSSSIDEATRDLRRLRLWLQTLKQR